MGKIFSSLSFKSQMISGTAATHQLEGEKKDTITYGKRVVRDILHTYVVQWESRGHESSVGKSLEWIQWSNWLRWIDLHIHLVPSSVGPWWASTSYLAQKLYPWLMYRNRGRGGRHRRTLSVPLRNPSCASANQGGLVGIERPCMT